MNLPLPTVLETLLANGVWPPTHDRAIVQNLRSIAPPERVQAIAPGESTIYLYPPPFQTVRAEMESGHPFWKIPASRLQDLDPDRVVPFGDFGLGSDAPLVLDYTTERGPCVRRLRWSPDGSTEWVHVADTLDAFVEAIGIYP